MRLAGALILFLLTATQLQLPAVAVTPGISLHPSSGYYVANLDPTLNSTENNEIYDPNFIPGFRVDLKNMSVNWDTVSGSAHIGYSIGPWESLEVGLPHLAVGPQCCNFVEVPRTQQYRREDWGDYYYVKAGFSSPGVNLPDFTSNFTAPAYVGLRTDWQWIVGISLDWTSPHLLNKGDEWAAIGIAATQYVPNVRAKLVYTVVNFWMDGNSSRILSQFPGSSPNRFIAGPRVVVYPAYQMSNAEEGNQTITVNLSPYLTDTLDVLGYANSTAPQPPVISYIYLNIEGYNVQWNTTLYSFFVMTNENPTPQGSAINLPLYFGATFTIATVAALSIFLRDRKRRGAGKGPNYLSLAKFRPSSSSYQALCQSQG